MRLSTKKSLPSGNKLSFKYNEGVKTTNVELRKGVMMIKKDPITKAKIFRKLHEKTPFLLPNAWNGGSAKIFASQGFSAIGTTSAGISYAMGYADGENIGFADLLKVTKEIVNAVDLPISVDIERGYGASLDEIVDHVKSIILCGAIGINIEDGLPQQGSVDDQATFVEKIQAIAEVRTQIGIPFVINARTDIYLLGVGDEKYRLDMTLKRAQALRKAGADCIFIPDVSDETVIKQLRAEIELPINLLVHPNFCDIEKMRDIGINRLSSGSAPVRATMKRLMTVAKDFNRGECADMMNHDFSYAKANELFNKK
jgi:2-methylisocitrate lyase-like PEP mutase family enzyme